MPACRPRACCGSVLRRRAEPGALRVGDAEGADAYVHVIAGERGDADVAVLRRARVPAVVVRPAGLAGGAEERTARGRDLDPGADLPVLTLDQFRLVLRLAQAYGEDDARELVPELAATVGAGLGLRAIAREVLDLAPGAGWAVKGAVAYAGTRALGEAARLRLAPASTRPRAAASPAAP